MTFSDVDLMVKNTCAACISLGREVPYGRPDQLYASPPPGALSIRQLAGGTSCR